MKPLLPTPSSARGALRQRGFTLVEMMVALAIGLVLVLGFAVSFVNLKVAYGAQDKLSQLQDSERLAMSFLTSSVEEAGYFPDPTSANPINVPTNATLDPTYGVMPAKNIIFGQASSGSGSSFVSATLSTAYVVAPGDGILNCQGGSSPSTESGIVTYRNVFHVDATNHTLNCFVTASDSSLSANDTPLVSNVSSMEVYYAVDTDGDGSADKYLQAGSMTTAYWAAVKSVRVTLNFINPNASIDGTATFAWTQTINMMNNR